MNDKHTLSARVKAASEGCYEGSRAAALSGVPVSTVYLWARTGVVKPSVSPTKIKLWSYADLMALRIVYWLRHPKEGQSSYIAASPMQRVRDGLAELERHGLDIWDDSGSHPGSPLRVDSSGNIFVVDENVARVGGQQPLPGVLDLLGPFESYGRWGPDLVRPRPNTRTSIGGAGWVPRCGLLGYCRRGVSGSSTCRCCRNAGIRVRPASGAFRDIRTRSLHPGYALQGR